MAINPRLAFPAIAEEPQQLLKAIKGYEKEPLVCLEKACEPLFKILDELDDNIKIAIKNSINPPDGLSQDESASIHLYTMEWEDSNDSLYAVLNRTLRTPERQMLRPWFRYLKLFLTALFKLPSVKGQLWRGIRGDLTDIYPKDESIIWWSFSSCTNSLDVLQKPQFIGNSGVRTLFCIENVTNGKNISGHSYFKKENEIILLPGTCLQVHSLIHRTDGFHLVHLRQTRTSSELLVSPFDHTPTEISSSRTRRTSIQLRSNVNHTFKSQQYDLDDDSSDDDRRNSSYQHLKFPRNIDTRSDISSSSDNKSSNNTKSETNRIPKLQTQKNVKDHIEINYVDRMGSYVVVQNTSSSSRNMTGWSITKKTDTNQKLTYEFPDHFILKSRVPVRIIARNTSKKSSTTTPRDGMISLIADNIATWGTGTNMITQLIDDDGEEQARYIQTFV